MNKSALIIAGLFAAGITFAADGNKEKGGDKPRHHGPPPFEKMDADKDGKISMDEFKAHAPKEASPERIAGKFKKLDANGDGFIAKDEFPKPGEGGHKRGGDGDKRKEK